MIVEVSDEGIGMNEESISNLFRPFFQVSRNSTQGSGLGLYICRELARLMRGHVCCRSELGKGSSFTVVLPIVAGRMESSPPHSMSSISSVSRSKCEMSEGERHVQSIVSRHRVLVAEDNKVNRLVVGNMLKRLGCEYDMCDNGKLALESFEQGDYFLVLMDLMMPVMDGFEATKRILSSAHYAIKRPRIIALTASVTDSEIQAALSSGCHSVISKPVNLEKLRVAIRESALYYHERTRARFALGTTHRDLSFFPS